MTTRTTRTTTDDLVTRLLALCERRTSGVSYCQMHQVGNRCTTCQAADVISRALTEIGRLHGILDRLNIEVRSESA